MVGRIEFDDVDVRKIEEFLIQHNPFRHTDGIMSTASRITGDEKINCFDAFEKVKKFVKKLTVQILKSLNFREKKKLFLC